jgi:hypothetical protein
MSHSVKITTPIPSPEEIASDLGVTRNRLDGLLALVDGRTKNSGRNDCGSARTSGAKKVAKKASARQRPAKHGRSAR